LFNPGELHHQVYEEEDRTCFSVLKEAWSGKIARKAGLSVSLRTKNGGQTREKVVPVIFYQ
jgi:hypothetical protein